jgi:hypothetical protein
MNITMLKKEQSKKKTKNNNVKLEFQHAREATCYKARHCKRLTTISIK